MVYSGALNDCLNILLLLSVGFLPSFSCLCTSTMFEKIQIISFLQNPEPTTGGRTSPSWTMPMYSRSPVSIF